MSLSHQNGLHKLYTRISVRFVVVSRIHDALDVKAAEHERLPARLRAQIIMAREMCLSMSSQSIGHLKDLWQQLGAFMPELCHARAGNACQCSTPQPRACSTVVRRRVHEKYVA